MRNWFRSMGWAVGMGLGWMLAGMFIGLMVFEGLIDPDGHIVDIWPAALGYPAFFGGMLFFMLVRLFERRRPLHEVPFPRAAIWGALAGPLLLALFLLGIETGVLGDWKGDVTPWAAVGAIGGFMSPAFAVAAASSVWFVRQVKPALEQ